MKKTTLLVLCVLCLGCIAPQSQFESTMYQKASALTKLSRAVESTVRYENPPEGISEQELLNLSTNHDPSLQGPFKGYKLRVLAKDRHAVVLMCTESEDQGLLEDAGCSAELDRHLWKDPVKHPCEFSLDLSIVCGP